MLVEGGAGAGETSSEIGTRQPLEVSSADKEAKWDWFGEDLDAFLTANGIPPDDSNLLDFVGKKLP